jgi:hypothetical protein
MLQDKTKGTLNQLPQKIDYAYKLGKVSYNLGKHKNFNPYERGGVDMAHLAQAWNMGWDDALEENVNVSMREMETGWAL